MIKSLLKEIRKLATTVYPTSFAQKYIFNPYSNLREIEKVVKQ